MDFLHVEFAHEFNRFCIDNLSRNHDRESRRIWNYEVCRDQFRPLFQTLVNLRTEKLQVFALILAIRCKECKTSEGDMRLAFFAAYREDQCEHLKLFSPEIDKRLKEGPELVSANFVIPYPPGFPIMVPGQVINAETIEFMRKLDVKEIHGFSAALGFKLLNPAAIQSSKTTSKSGSDLSGNAKPKKARSAVGD